MTKGQWDIDVWRVKSKVIILLSDLQSLVPLIISYGLYCLRYSKPFQLQYLTVSVHSLISKTIHVMSPIYCGLFHHSLDAIIDVVCAISLAIPSSRFIVITTPGNHHTGGHTSLHFCSDYLGWISHPNW